MGIENIKALYKKAGAFNAIASVNSKSTPGSGLHSASALIAHVTANPLRVDESDDEIVIGQLATTYRKAIKELYLSELEPTNQLAFDCIVHITLNCNKAVRASMEIASAINVSARFGGFAVAMNPLPSSGTANIFYFASSAKRILSLPHWIAAPCSRVSGRLAGFIGCGIGGGGFQFHLLPFNSIGFRWMVGTC